MWTSKVHDSLTNAWAYSDYTMQQFTAITMPLWIFATVVGIVCVVSALDLIRLRQRDKNMGRNPRAYGGPAVELAIYKIIRGMTISGEMTEKQFDWWVRFFAWHGLPKFMAANKKLSSRKISGLKVKIMQRLGKEDSDKPVNIPG